MFAKIPCAHRPVTPRHARQYRRNAHRACLESLESRTLLSVSLDANGWTTVTAATDTRIIYVSSSQGSDSNNGLSTSTPVATVAKGMSLARDGMADWVLLKRGDVFTEGLSIGKGGRSANEPLLVSAYGSGTTRPMLRSGTAHGISVGGRSSFDFVDVIGLNFYANTRDPSSPSYNASVEANGMEWLNGGNSDLFENNVFQYYSFGIDIQAYFGPITNVSFRRNIVADSYSDASHSEGIYASGSNYSLNGMTLDGNLFDHNGWYSATLGVQTIYNHNAYIQANITNFTAINNIFSNASSHGLQARCGGNVQNNLFINNPIALSYGLVNGSPVAPNHTGVHGIIDGNVILGSRDIDGATRGWAIEIWNTSTTLPTTISNNIIANDSQNAFPAIQLAIGDNIDNPADETGLNNLTITGNVVYNWHQALSIAGGYVPGGTGGTGFNNVVIQNNDFQQMLTSTIIDHGIAYAAAEEQWSGNRYYDNSAQSGWFDVNGNTTSWTSWHSTIDTTGTATQVSYPDPTRTVDTYNATLGGAANVTAFLAVARQQSPLSWDTRYTAASAINYVRGGYGLSAIGTVAAPSALTASTVSASQINLAWTDNANNETGFVLDQATDSGFTQNLTSLNLAANAVSYSVTGLASGTTYYFRLRAVTATLTSGYSNTASATTTTLAGLPTAPSALAATAVSASQINLTWTDNATNETGYILDRATDNAFTQGLTTVTLAANTTSSSVTGLISGTTYYFRVRASNAVGNSANSNTASATTAATLPAAPSGLTATTVSASQINLAWSDNSNNETGFSVDVATDSGFTQNLTTAVLAPNSTSYVAAGLNGSTTYYFRVRASNSAGNSANSNTASATTPTAPNVWMNQAFAAQSGNFTVDFDAQPVQNNSDTVIGLSSAPAAAYTDVATIVRFNTSGTIDARNDAAYAALTTLAYSSGTNYHFTLVVRVAQYRYDVYVTPQGGAQVLLAQNYAFRTEQNTVTSLANWGKCTATGDAAVTNFALSAAVPTIPTAPSGLVATAASTTQINLTWTDNATNETGFSLDRATDNGFTQNLTTVSLAAGTTSYSATGLAAGTTYYYRVCACGSAGDSADSNTASATTASVAPTAPAAPSGLTATAASSSKITLTWTNNATGVTSFVLERATDSAFSQGLTTVKLAATATSYSATGLASVTTYYFRIRAVSSSGTSLNSNVATATTLVALPAAPSNLSAVVVSSSQINLTWKDNATNETGYVVQVSTSSNFSRNLTTITLPAGSTSVSVTGLSANTVYYFRVYAFNSAGKSSYSSRIYRRTNP